MNRDDLSDLHGHLAKSFDSVMLAAGPSLNGGRLYDTLDEILNLPPYERQSITLIPQGTTSIGGQDMPIQFGRIELNFADAPFISLTGEGLVGRDEHQKMLSAFTAIEPGVSRRVPAIFFERFAKACAGLFFLGLYAWACVFAASLRNLPLLIVVGLAVLYILGTASQSVFARKIFGRFARSKNRLRYEDLSRIEFESARRNRRADTKAGLIGVVAGAILAVAGMAIIRSIFG